MDGNMIFMKKKKLTDLFCVNLLHILQLCHQSKATETKTW